MEATPRTSWANVVSAFSFTFTALLDGLRNSLPGLID